MIISCFYRQNALIFILWWLSFSIMANWTLMTTIEMRDEQEALVFTGIAIRWVVIDGLRGKLLCTLSPHFTSESRE